MTIPSIPFLATIAGTIIMALLLAGPVLLPCRNAAASAAVGLLDLAAAPFCIVRHLLDGDAEPDWQTADEAPHVHRRGHHAGAIPVARRLHEQVIEGLRSFGGAAGQVNPPARVFLIAIPLVDALLLALLTLGDLWAAYLTVQAIFLPDAPLPPGISWFDWLLAALAMLSLATTAAVLFPLYGKGPAVTPYSDVRNPSARRRLQMLCLVAVVLVVVGAGCAVLWRFLRVEGSSVDVLAGVWILTWGLVAALAVALYSWIFPAACAVLKALALLSSLGLMHLLSGIAALVIAVLDAVAGMIVSLLDTVLALSRLIWNWLTSFAWAERAHLRPIVCTPRPHVGVAPFAALSAFRSALSGRSSVPTPEVPTMARSLPRTTIALALGHTGISMLDAFRVALDALGATDTVAAMGRAAAGRPLGKQRVDLGRDGVVDVSPDPDSHHNAIDRDPASQTVAHVHAMMDAAIHVMHVRAGLSGLVAWMQGLDTPAELTSDSLRELAVRRPERTIMVVAAVPTPDRRDSRLCDGVATLDALHHAGIVDATVLTDERSPLARAVGPVYQAEYLGRALAALQRAPRDYEANPSVVDITRALSRLSPKGLAMISCASECVSPGPGHPGYAVVRRVFGLPGRGIGSLDDLVSQSIAAAERSLTKRECRAIDAPIECGHPFFVVLTAPLRPTDSRWPEYIGAMGKWLAVNYPAASPVYTTGPGQHDPRTPGSYWVQASAIVPVPDVPGSLAALLAELCEPVVEQQLPDRGDPEIIATDTITKPIPALRDPAVDLS